VDDGSIRWEYPVERGCETSIQDYFGGTEVYPDCSFFYALSASVTSSNDVVFAPGLDGKVRAFHAPSGRLLWQYDTARPFTTTNGHEAHGGSMDSVGVQFAEDMAYMQSGYSNFGQLPGNVLLAFRLAN
jgi:polyvinyl alcohol dehydrogenase (cytochrome)